MVSQAITLPTGAHGLFQKFAIQALTLEATEYGPNSDTPIPITLLQLGRVVEGIFRSLNNLLEKFNRSYWFYLLPSTRRYVSIGYYMISFGLLAMPLIFKALQIYLTNNSEQGEDDKSEKSEKRMVESLPLLDAIPVVFVSNLLGIALLSVPFLVEKYQAGFRANIETHDLIYFTLLTLSAMFMFNPLIRLNSTAVNHMQALHCVALLNMALMLSCVSLINISLALGLTLVYVPIACTLANKSHVGSSALFNTTRKITQTLLMILLHPIAINYLCLLGLSVFYDQTPTPAHFVRAFNAQKKVILFYVEDWYIYGNWTYFFACSFLFPAWFQLWNIL